ncbi:hypothetical protein BX666DRAFT_168247 [Dichotomocladium elegans]|nr:hypothetical protein BX666DRAFT_168247 [Dichotomocladium elegans]
MNYHQNHNLNQNHYRPGQNAVGRVFPGQQHYHYHHQQQQQQHPPIVINGLTPLAPRSPARMSQQQYPCFTPSYYYHAPSAGMNHHSHPPTYHPRHRQSQTAQYPRMDEPKRISNLYKPHRHSVPLPPISSDDDIPLAMLQRTTNKRYTQPLSSSVSFLAQQQPQQQQRQQQQHRYMSQITLAPGPPVHRGRSTTLSSLARYQTSTTAVHPDRASCLVRPKSNSDSSSRPSLVSQRSSSSSVTTSSSDSSPPPSTPPSPLSPQDHSLSSRPSIAKRLLSRLSRSSTSTTLSSARRAIA